MNSHFRPYLVNPRRIAEAEGYCNHFALLCVRRTFLSHARFSKAEWFQALELIMNFHVHYLSNVEALLSQK